MARKNRVQPMTDPETGETVKYQARKGNTTQTFQSEQEAKRFAGVQDQAAQARAEESKTPEELVRTDMDKGVAYVENPETGERVQEFDNAREALRFAEDLQATRSARESGPEPGTVKAAVNQEETGTEEGAEKDVSEETGTTEPPEDNTTETDTTKTAGGVDIEMETGGMEETSPRDDLVTDLEEKMTKAQNRIKNDFIPKLEQVQQSMDERNAQMIENIKQTFNARIESQRRTNKALMGATKKLGARSGRQRYAPQLQQEIVSEQESKAISRISDLERKKQSAILEARQAADERDFKLLNQKMQTYENLYNKEVEQIMKTSELQAQQEQMAMEKAKFGWTKREKAFERAGQLIKSGVTYDSLSEEQITSLSEDADMDKSSMKSYMKAKQNTIEAQRSKTKAETKKKELEAIGSLYDTLEKMPSSQSIKFNGATYQGLKKEEADDDRYEYHTTEETNEITGEVTKATAVFDKKKQEYVKTTTTSIGKVATPKEPDNEETKNKKQTYNAAKRVRDLAQDVKNSAALGALTGQLGQWLPSPKTFFEAAPFQDEGKIRETTVDLNQKWETLTDKLLTEELDKMTGPLTDKDLDVLKNAATTLDKSQSVGAIKEELDRIIDKSTKAMENANNETLFQSQKPDTFKEGGTTFDKNTGDSIFKEESTQKTSMNLENAPSIFDEQPDDEEVSLSINSSKAGKGTVTAFGSPLWEHGLDYVLEGGKGAEAKSPFSGEVIATRPESETGGFGNQVKIMTDDGSQVWISHLDEIGVQEGQRVNSGDPIGKQGNSGNVIPISGDGTHIDLTIKKPDGSYMRPESVSKLLNNLS